MRSITNNPSQEAIRAKCVHPSGVFVEFKKEEIEQSIPDRFEKIVARYPDRIAVKTKADALAYCGVESSGQSSGTCHSGSV